MRNRRRGRPRTHGAWTPESSARAHAAKARLRMKRGVETAPRRVPAGQYLGTLRWYAADGALRGWVVTQGDRANNIGVVAKLAGSDLVRRFGGWDWLLKGLRKRLAVKKVIYD